MEQAYDNTMLKTSFAPQETQQEYAQRLQQKRMKNIQLQSDLQNMIDQKAEERRQARQNKLDEENENIR